MFANGFSFCFLQNLQRVTSPVMIASQVGGYNQVLVVLISLTPTRASNNTAAPTKNMINLHQHPKAQGIS